MFVHRLLCTATGLHFKMGSDKVDVTGVPAKGSVSWSVSPWGTGGNVLEKLFALY